MKNNKPKIFTKVRIANILSAVIILEIITAFIYGVIPDGASEVLAGVLGMAAMYLWRTCARD